MVVTKWKSSKISSTDASVQYAYILSIYS